MNTPALFILAVAGFSGGTGAVEAHAEPASVGCELRVTDRPLVQRGFMPDSSPRSIAVGLPGGLSYCFDTELGSIRYVWRGGFLDMKPTWNERGAKPPLLIGDRFFVGPDMAPFRVGAVTSRPQVKFQGYKLTGGWPEFRFTVDGVKIRQRAEPAEDGGLKITFEVEAGDEALWFLSNGTRVRSKEEDLPRDEEGWVRIPRPRASHFEVLITGPASAGPAKSASSN